MQALALENLAAVCGGFARPSVTDGGGGSNRNDDGTVHVTTPGGTPAPNGDPKNCPNGFRLETFDGKGTVGVGPLQVPIAGDHWQRVTCLAP